MGFYKNFLKEADFQSYWSHVYSNKLTSAFSNPELLLFNNVSDYLSAATILRHFDSNHQNNDGYAILDNLRIQSFLENASNEAKDELLNLVKISPDNDFFNYNIFFNSNFFSNETVLNLNLLESTSKISEEIKYLSEAKNHFETLSDFFPKYSDTLELFDVLVPNDDNSLYEDWSTPDFKLYYPEPFIASASFMHEQLWFIHILHYQHWLWFMFISLIMFYFITFMNVVRWCNPRVKPKRETRGVSRSKCADLITASVPVSWATSIIISETVDAADYYDGFGTGELVVGIRAYQWGWEYYYPKGLDLNYNVSPTYSAAVGNSLKYTTTNLKSSESNTFWKNINMKTTGKVTSTPAHLILSPLDNSKVLNFLNFNEIGSDSLVAANAFKRIQFFSKTNPQELFSNTSDFSLKYSKFNNLYQNDTNINNSMTYGTLRQHNYNSSSSFTNQFNTFLDPKSVEAFMGYNYDYLKDNYLNINLEDRKFLNNNSTTQTSTLFLNFLNQNNYNISKINNYPNFLNSLNIYNDGKQVKNTFKFLLEGISDKNNLSNANWFYDSNLSGEIHTPTTNISSSFKALNTNLEYAFTDMKSGDQQLLASERNPRNLVNPIKSNLNLGLDKNLMSEVLNKNLKTNTASQEELYNLSNLNWGKTSVLNKLADTKTFFPNSHIPAISTNSEFDVRSFSKFTDNNSAPTMFRSKEEAAPNFIFETYWLNYWANTDISKRLNIINLNNNALEESYIPTFTEYAEYDFRNWQALELLEDAFWESTYSSFSQDEYLNTLQNINEHTFFKKQEELFNNLNRSKKFKLNSLAKPLIKDTTVSSNINTLPIFSEDFIPNTLLTNLKDFKTFSIEPTIDTLDDSYENIKFLNHLHSLNYMNTLNLNVTGLQPVSYTNILNMFRPGYDESSWNLDNFVDNNNTNYVDFNEVNDLRISNPLKLRSTAKSSIVTYSAIQKVFKSRYDEGRANARLQDISNSYPKHLFISEQKTPYESLLGKNKESFFNTNNYNHSLTLNFNDIFANWNTLNTYFTDLPFLISAQSDSSRFLWFDWHSRWTSIEVQPSSVSRYSLLGVPYHSKNFEYSTQTGDNINESETYLIRLGRARKNYMSNWAYTPYFYSRVSNWYKVNNIFNPLMADFSIHSLRMSLELASNYWDSNVSNNDYKTTSTPSYSGVNTPNRSFWKPESSLASHYYNVSTFVDLLTKREYLYREYFLNKGYSINLPNYLTSNPANPLLVEVQKSYPFIDPSSFTSEISRELFYQNSNFLQLNLLKNFSNFTQTTINNLGLNTNFLNNYFFFYLFDNTSNPNLGKNLDLFKDQYRPMKKGITNMIRLHATGAIAMPTEIRLHILASSRDVIHSWAIPSAGIKIDCVPGFSTHRVAIFLLSGIFWGQCMEICGRFHHWMPIVVYFMKRDLFFLWCTHFIHFSSEQNNFNTTDKQLASQLRLVTFNKSLWLDEVSSTL